MRLRISIALVSGLLLLEALLAVRSWLQITASDASGALEKGVAWLTVPLVLPFAHARPSGIAGFDSATTLAAEAYLVAGLVLLLCIAVSRGPWRGRARLHEGAPARHTRHNGVILAQPGAARDRGAYLHNTIFLPIGIEQAYRALRQLRMDRFDLDLELIPAAGGCVVAVFAAPHAGGPRAANLGGLRTARDEFVATRMLQALNARLSASCRPVEAFGK